jgi:hypothetical protein
MRTWDPGWAGSGSARKWRNRRKLTDEDDGEECGVGVDHAGALPPGAAAPEKGHDEDDHSCKHKKKLTLKVRRQVPIIYDAINIQCFGSGFTKIRIMIQVLTNSVSRPFLNPETIRIQTQLSCDTNDIRSCYC